MDYDPEKHAHRQSMQELSFRILDIHLRVVALTVACERMPVGSMYSDTMSELLNEATREFDRVMDEMRDA